MISDYMRAERIDFTEPAGFYVPGITDWNEMNRRDAKAYLAGRAQKENEDPDENDGTSEQLH